MIGHIVGRTVAALCRIDLNINLVPLVCSDQLTLGAVLLQPIGGRTYRCVQIVFKPLYLATCIVCNTNLVATICGNEASADCKSECLFHNLI